MNLKRILTVAVCAASLNFSGQVFADSFKFGFTFSDGAVLTGFLDGIMVGDTITGATNITASINGTSLTGPLYESSFFPFSLGAGSSVFSTDFAKNDWILMDVQYPGACCGTNYIYTYGANNYGSNYIFSIDFSTEPRHESWSGRGDSFDSWSLTPVPEPESYALLISGLALLGFVTRRRKLKGAMP